MNGLAVLVLGPVVVRAGADILAVERPLECALLTRLALAGVHGIPDERLIADLWDDGQGEVRQGRLRVLASRLRGTLGGHGDTLVRAGGGYAIAATVPDLTSARKAADRLYAADRTGNAREVRTAASAALDVWRGPALANLHSVPYARAEAERLDAWRLELTVHRLRADVELGAAAEVVNELATLAAQNPLHEQIWCMYAVALYRTGRQADALARLATLRRSLVADIGADPAAETAELELRLLRHDPALLADRREVVVPTEPAGQPLVGRDDEVAQLTRLLDQLATGRPGILLVEGEAGIGKTRLLEELDRLAVRRGARVHWGRGSAEDGVPAYWPWRQALRELREQTDPRVIDTALGDGGDRLAAILPELSSGAVLAGKPPAEIDGEARFALFELVTGLLAATARAGPGLVLVLDDLHWADTATLLLLGHAGRHLVDAGLLIAASFRPRELRADHTARDVVADLARQRVTSRIELAGLSTTAVAAQLRLIVGVDCDAGLASAVAHRTGGNPLFVGEIGQLLVSSPDADLAAIPTGVRDAIGTRLAALPARCHQLLSVAAVLAADLDAGLLATVTGAPVEEVMRDLDDAIDHAIVDRHYRFVHDIVRDCLRLDVPESGRRRAQLAAAAHLEAVGGDQHRIAHHLLEALPLGNRERAVGAAAQAADNALERLAFEEAARLFGRAAAAVSGDAGKGDLLLRLAKAQVLSHDMSAAMDSCEEAAAIATRTGDAAMLGRAALVLQDVSDPRWLPKVDQWCRQALVQLAGVDSSIRAQLLAQQAISRIWGDDWQHADDASRSAIAMAERLDEASALRSAFQARQLVRSTPEGTGERLALGDRMLGLAGRTGDSAALWGRLWRFDAYVQLGHIGQAEAELQRLEPVVARLAQPLARWHLIRSRAGIDSGRGRFADAYAGAEEALRIVAGGRHPSAVFPSHALRLSICLLTGDELADPELPEIERYHPPPRLLSLMTAEWHATHGRLADAERLYATLPRPETIDLKPFMHVLFHACSGTVAAAVGDLRAAAHAYENLLPYADQHVTAGAGAAFTRGSAHLPLGLIAAATGRPDDAITHLGAAVVSNRHAGLEPYAALAQCVLAEQSSDAEAAAQAAATASRLGMSWLRDRAQG